jgi:regulator of protease activity HflC (stomatin/prohibitin superfamily)
VDPEAKLFVKWGALAVVVLFGLITFFSSYVVVKSGYVGVVTTLGKVTGEMQPGFSWKTPFVQHVTQMNVQVQKDQTEASAASKDLQTVSTTIALNYHLDHAQVSNVYVNLSADYADRIVSPAVQETLKAVTATFNAEQLLTERAEVSNQVNLLLIQKLQPRGVLVDQVSIVNFRFGSEFAAAIESKQVAQQDAQKAQYTLQQAQLNAQANQAQQAALTDQILEQQAIARWNGVMPTTLTSGASLFNIPVGK